MRGTLDTISALSREGISEVRDLMNTMERKVVTWDDLFAEIIRYGSVMLEPHSIEFFHSLIVQSADEELDLSLYSELLRVFKELLSI